MSKLFPRELPNTPRLVAPATGWHLPAKLLKSQSQQPSENTVRNDRDRRWSTFDGLQPGYGIVRAIAIAPDGTVYAGTANADVRPDVADRPGDFLLRLSDQ